VTKSFRPQPTYTYQNAFIVSVARTPVTQAFKGALAALPSTELGSVAIKGALARAKVAPDAVEEVYFGQVLQGAAGQAPARQAALGAGLPKSVICTTVNKVCASGMKSVMLAAQSIKCGDKNIVVAGGMESMSQVPWYLNRAHRGYGKIELIDGIEYDGLTDAYDKIHMGMCAENTCKKHGITRQDQDEYAISSYKRSAQAHESGKLAKEIVPVVLAAKKASASPKTVTDDEEFRKVDFSKVPQLAPAFDRSNGTVTAANASTLNDGAAATLLMSARAVDKHKLSAMAEIVAYADAACEPIDFPLAPALSIPKVSTQINLLLTVYLYHARLLSMSHSKLLRVWQN
jgi:acetyl-CoA C-acetyltransferase